MFHSTSQRERSPSTHRNCLPGHSHHHLHNTNQYWDTASKQYPEKKSSPTDTNIILFKETKEHTSLATPSNTTPLFPTQSTKRRSAEPLMMSSKLFRSRKSKQTRKEFVATISRKQMVVADPRASICIC